MTVDGSKGFEESRFPENPNPFKDLTGAIIKFMEVYERVETSKLQNRTTSLLLNTSLRIQSCSL